MSDLNQVLSNSNQFYSKKIERPYADLDFSQLRWDQVITIMQKQALAAQLQTMSLSQSTKDTSEDVGGITIPHPSPPQPEDLLPLHIACDYSEIPFNYSTKINGNPSSNSEESDSSSYCSSSSRNTESDMSDSSDTEIDVEDCSDDNMDCDETEFYSLMSTSPSNIPITVLQLESEISKRERQSSWRLCKFHLRFAKENYAKVT